MWPRSAYLVLGRVLLQLSVLILVAEDRGDCAIDLLVPCYGCTMTMYMRHRHRHLRDLVVVQLQLPAPDIFGMPIGMTNCTWDPVDTVITMLLLLAGWLDRI